MFANAPSLICALQGLCLPASVPCTDGVHAGLDQHSSFLEHALCLQDASLEVLGHQQKVHKGQHPKRAAAP